MEQTFKPSHDVTPALDHTEEVLTPDMEAEAFPIEVVRDMPLDGFDEETFARTVAETASAFLPADADPKDFVERYVRFTVPLLKLGEFKKLTAGATLGSLVENHPWIGWLICGGALVGGFVLHWPRPKPKEQEEPEEPEYAEYGTEWRNS